MTAADILDAMSKDDTLAEQVLHLLNQGMWDEWDTSLVGGLDMGFGGAELRIAARTAHAIAINQED
jgi:hypothetical protein